MKYELPEIPYEYDGLEPHIDAKTMEIHHSKHHQGYVDKLNSALEKHPEIADTPLEDLLANLDSVPEDIRDAVRNNGGGHFNHSLFWTVMSPLRVGGGGEPGNDIGKAIEDKFEEFDKFKEEFATAATGQFGSGWAWLVLNNSKELEIYSTPNQDNPIMKGDVPLLGLDMWEHAFYLKWGPQKAEYIKAWWNTVNWEQVGMNYSKSLE